MRKKFGFCLFVLYNLFGCIICLNAQPSEFKWAKSAGGISEDYCHSNSMDRFGNTIITGYFKENAFFGNQLLSSSGANDIFVAKYDKHGNIIWAKRAGGVGNDEGYSVTTDKSGNSIITGIFTLTTTFDTISLTSNGGSDLFIVKYGVSGNLKWLKKIGGIEADYGWSIDTDGLGNILITGCFRNNVNFDTITLASTGDYDIFIVKIDTSGNILWAKQAGGINSDIGYSITSDDLGNCFVTGEFSGPAIFDSNTLHGDGIFIAKYGPDGNLLWVRQAIGNDTFVSTSIKNDHSGRCCITGYFKGNINFGNFVLISEGEYDIFVAKYDSHGNVLWAKRSGGSNYDVAHCITTDLIGNCFVSGSFKGTSNFGNHFLNCHGEYPDIFVVKYDTTGQVIWAKRAGGTSYDNCNSIDTDGMGNYTIAGFFEDASNFDTFTLNSSGSRDIFVANFFEEVAIIPFDTTAPAIPINFEATLGNQQVTLAWSANTEQDLNYYKIYRSKTQNFTPTANDSIAVVFKPNTSYVDNNVTNGQTYYYRITAVDQSDNESDFSDEVNATPHDKTAPSTPQNLQATSGDQQISLIWATNSEPDLSYYKIYRSQTQNFSPSTNDSIAVVFKPKTRYEDNEVINGQTYYYRITAVDTIGNESAFSGEVRATPHEKTAPSTPQNLQATPGKQQVTLTWTINTETDLNYYKIYRSQTQNFTPTSNDSLAIIFKPDTSYTDTDVINGQTYYYRISAVDSSGNESDFSDEVSATPQAVVTPANILLSVSSYDFGSVVLDSTKMLTFFIKNSGQELLEIYSIKNTQSVFTANPTSGTIHENDSLEITIFFTPGVERVYQDTFKISSNDPDEAVVQFFVQGQGVASPKPSIYLSNISFDFGDVPVFSTSSKQLTIQNKGNGDLNIENIVSDNSVFNVSATQFTITPGNQQTVQINFTPDNVQTETGTLTITSNDPDQSELLVNLTGTGIDDQAPEITLQSPSQQLWVGSDFQVTAQVTDNWNITSVLLYYRNGTSKTFQIISMNHSQENNYLATIPGSAMFFEGLAYFVRAEDSAGYSAFSDTLSPKIYFTDGSFSTNSSNSGYASGYSRGQWRMLSIPAILNSAGVSSVLNDETELGSYGEPNWRLFSYEDTDDDGIKDGYQEYSSSLESSIFQFASGKSFWLKANPEGEKIIIDVGAGYVLPLENQMITLKPGWNQIGNPIAFPIAFDPTHQNIVDKLYLPDGTGGYTLTNSMLPWAGYFVFVSGTEQVSYDITPVFSTLLHKPIIEKTEWLIQLCATCGNCKDEINYFGISQLSSNDWDKKDYPEPPVIGEYVSLRFPHSDWSEFCKYYTADIRHKIGDGQIWNFEIHSNLSNTDKKLNWEKLVSPESELHLTLYDKDKNKTVDMNLVSEYFFSPLNQKRVSNFQIFAGDEDFVEQQLEEIRSQLPDSYRLFQNYPNPFNSTTIINFELPKEKYVKLILYNMIGEEQKILVQDNYGVGFHKVLLDAKELSSGLYIYKLETGGFVDVKKLVVLK